MHTMTSWNSFGDMQEIPTFHAKPLTPACDNWCPFPVADRPNAVRQFFEAAAKDPSLIQAPWILLIETDYVWMKPLQQVPTAESSSKSWAFKYGYIMPTYPCTRLTSVMSRLVRHIQLFTISRASAQPFHTRHCIYYNIFPILSVSRRITNDDVLGTVHGFLS